MNNIAQEKIWYGPRKPMQYDEKTSIGKVLLESLLKDPERIAQICCHNDKQYTNLEIADLSINIARNLKKIGLKQGDIIGFCGTNSDFVAPLIIGAQFCGIVVSTADPTFGKDNMKHNFSITKPLVIFCDGSNFERVRTALAEINLLPRIYTMCEHIEGVPEISELLTGLGTKNPFSCDPLEKDYLQTAMILFSSGTTGPPKGVCFSHAGILRGSLIEYFKAEDRVLCFSTMYWASGMMTLMRATALGSTRLITKNSFTVSEFIKIMNKYKTTAILSAPSQMAILAGSKEINTTDLSSIRTYFTVGNPISPASLSKMKVFMPQGEIFVGYGMTEFPCLIIASGVASNNGNTGKLLSNVELKIINDEGKSLDTNEIGEIVIRNNIPFGGYYGDTVKNPCDDNGWLYTGDIGYVNENEEIFVIDRKQAILKYNGYSFYPSELDNIILGIPDVVEVCVCGIPDEIATYLVAALVVIKQDSTLKETDIYEYVAKKMAKLEGGVYFVPEIPKTPSGKKDRRKAVELCQSFKQQKLL